MKEASTGLCAGLPLLAMSRGSPKSSGVVKSEASLPIIGLVSEQKRILEALEKHESLLLLGPRGCGKSTVIRAAIDARPAKSDIVYVPYSSALHQLLISLASALLQSGHRYLHQLASKPASRKKWFSEQTSLHLKGLLWNALEAEPRTIILDEVDGASHPIFRFMQRLYFGKGMAIFAAARDSVALGALSRLFWHPEKVIHFKPLSAIEAAQLFDIAVDRFHLGELDIEEFRRKVLDAADGNPGQIVEMCRLATNSQYVSGKYIKFAPLRIDAMMKFLS
ncbi:MAG TPA: AAA family ATPase [Bryobacteraceae bacterium]|nr:AAA family ATPase [Bryobacteraceae bacterium]